MEPLRITRPGGIIPRLSVRQLPEGAAQVASNVNVQPGEWQPLRKPLFLWAPSIAPDPLLSVFRLDETTWFGWPTANVRVERAPIEGEARFVISGDGVPKVITKALATPASASGLPAAARTLGIPAPSAAPTVGHSGGSGATVERFYVYTFVSDWQEESAPSVVSAFTSGKVDGTWALSGMDATPPNTGAITGATKTATTVTATTAAARHYLRVGDEVAVGSVAGMTDLNGVWTVAAVPAPNQFTVTLTTAQTYTSGGAWTRTEPWGACTKRIYRTAGSGGQFQLVAEGVTGTTYNDTLLDAQIPGDDLITDGWVPPPVNLTGIVSMPGGNLAGFIDGGRTVCFCEPYQPHAWPEAYRRAVPHDIVGIAAFGSNLGVVTKGLPLVFTGIDPAAMSPTKHEKPFPGLSRASVCSTADGVVFATKDGLAKMNLSGVGVFTGQLFMPAQWNALQPANISVVFDGRRLVIGTPVGNRLFLLDITDGDALVTAYQRLQCTHVDPQTGAVYFALGTRVYQFDAFGTAPMQLDWMSAEIVRGKPFNIGAAKVEEDPTFRAEAIAAIAAERAAIVASNTALMASVLGGRGSINGKAINALEINGSILEALPDATPQITFTLYAPVRATGEMIIVFSKVIPNGLGFRLPAGFKPDRFAVRLQANTQVAAVVLAETPRELAGA